MRKFGILLFLVAMVFSNELSAQGCSDAGFCTIGNIQSSVKDSSKWSKHTIHLFMSNGIGDEGVYVYTPSVQYEVNIHSAWSFQSKWTVNYASGNLGTIAGLGDLFLSSTYLLNPTKRTQHSISLGAKIPLNDGNLKVNGKALPMQYQSSLGTFDLIVGYNIKYKRWSANAAWQQPLSNHNGNTFLPSVWNSEEANKYAPSNHFNRKGDVLARVGYQLVYNKKWKWLASVLSIYHLGEDTYLDPLVNNIPIKIAGSKGLTLNVTYVLSYPFNKWMSIGISGGMPIIVRKVRPDGLTRSFVITPDILFHF